MCVWTSGGLKKLICKIDVTVYLHTCQCFHVRQNYPTLGCYFAIPIANVNIFHIVCYCLLDFYFQVQEAEISKLEGIIMHLVARLWPNQKGSSQLSRTLSRLWRGIPAALDAFRISSLSTFSTSVAGFLSLLSKCD